MKSTSLSLSTLTLSLALVGCGSDDKNTSTNTNGDRSGGSQSNYSLLDATSGKAFLDLASGHNVTVDDPWHFSYQKYVGFSINGGITGEGGVSACIAHTPEGIFDSEGAPVQAEFEKLTIENTLENFEAVDLTSCTEFSEDSLQTVISMSDWLAADYSQGAPVFTASTETTNGWIVRSATKNEADAYEYARVKVGAVDYQSGVKRGITLSVENWDSNGQFFETAVDSPELVFTDARIYWDLETNSIVTNEDNWDLSIVVNGRNWDLQVNGGVSGTGSAAIATLNVDSANDVTDPTSVGYLETAQIVTYSSDAAASTMSGPGSYGALNYGVDGGHGMWPNFTTYLFKDSDRYFKAQVVSNQGQDGTLASGSLYVRYAEITE